MNTFESLAVVSSESMQHQNFAEVMHTFAVMFERLPSTLQQRAEDIILRVLSALGDFVLTNELDSALSALVGALERCDRTSTGALVQRAQERLNLSIGRLNSRATRSQANGDYSGVSANDRKSILND